MADDKTFTQADIDKAIATAVEKVQASLDALEAKNAELVGEVRTAKQKARSASEIKPEDFAAAEDRAEKAEARAKELDGSVKALTKERDIAAKALEIEQGAARTYAVEAEIATAIAEGNVIPALVPAFKAMVMGQAKADLVDGKYAVSIGDKAAKEYITGFLGGEDGKAFKSSAINGGGGAPGGKGGDSSKSITNEALMAMPAKDRAAHFAGGGSIASVTA